MYVRKVRGKDKLGLVIMSSFELMICKKLGVAPDVWVKQQLMLIAKKRRWKWYLNEEKNT